MKISIAASLIAISTATCPFLNYSENPEPSNLYPGMRSSVVKTPGLLRDDESKGAFLGTMGACGNESLYQSYLLTDELYHCNMAQTLFAWAVANPRADGEEYCTWGFGELAPAGDSTNPDDYVPSASQIALIDQLGGATAAILIANSYDTIGQCALVGSTSGAVRDKAKCTADPTAEECATKDQVLQYSTAFAGFKINSVFQDFMTTWRTTAGTTGHKTNIDAGEVQGMMGAWIQKVVLCKDLPDYSSTYNYCDTACSDGNVALWKAQTSLWTPTEDNFTGCGYIGTEDNLEPVKFGDGCTGCENEQSAYPTSLLWLWITLPIVVLLGAGITIFFCNKQSKVDRDAALISHAQ